MVNPKSYSLAIRVDRNMKLSLNNSQFENLATFLDGYRERRQQVADNLMRGTPGDVLAIIDSIKEKSPSSGT